MKPATSALGRARPESRPSGVSEGWPLTGRGEELSRIGGLTRRRDGPAGVVLAGAAGVGKTLRSGETAPDAVTALWKDGHLPRLELGPLPWDETAMLVEARLGGPVDSVAARRLWSVTRGNALYLRQLVDGELESGRLGRVAGVWRWSGELALSPGLMELVSARIGQLPDAQREVVEVLAFGEPLGIPLLVGLTGAVAVEQVETRGLVEVYPDGRRWQARLAHPLYGEVQRARIGTLQARRLRGRIAQALADAGGRRADDTLRRAVLTLDSDLPPDPVLLTAAARRATELGDHTLATRVARAAVAAGGGFEPQLLLGHALGWSGRWAEGETEQAALGALARTDAQRAQAAIPQVLGLAWSFGRPAAAEAVLDALASTISDDAAALEVAGMRSVLDAHLGRTVQAAEAAAGVLTQPRCSPTATQLATWGLAMARGGLGRLEGVEEILRRIDARVESFESGLQAVVVASCLRGLLLAGLLDRADQIARRYRERCQDTPGYGQVMTSVMCAAVAMSRGQVRTAARWYRQAIAALHGMDPNGLLFSGLVGLAGALGMAGDAPSARQTLVEMTTARHPTCVYLEPNVRLAQAWVAAAEGGVSEAVALARQAAEVAASQDQPAVEVVALHTAVCFGDHTVADRLAQLATQVDGPRTPALAALTAPLPLTDREREIVTLAAGGLSNRDIAQRLTVSVRTVENHLYRASTKLGTTDRTELTTLLHGH